MARDSTLAIETRGLSKRYRGQGDGPPALDALDLAVPRGCVVGFLGPNGAGKTTTIRLLLDLLRPTSGACTVLGTDVARAPARWRQKLGYLAGDFAVPDRLPVDELLRFLADLRGGVDRARLDELCERLGVHRSKTVHALSKGNKQKVGLVQAFMHEPELLILDEPTSGLDPLLQHTFLDLVREAKARGQTVFMSSHVLSEVQSVADRIAIVRQGRLVEYTDVDKLEILHTHKVSITFGAPVPDHAFAAIEGFAVSRHTPTSVEGLLTGPADALIKAAAEHEVVQFRSREPDLEEVFLRHYSDVDQEGA